MKTYLITIACVVVALIAYDMFIKKLVLKESYEEGYEEAYED